MEVLKNLQDEVYVYSFDDLSIIFANRIACERCGWTTDQSTQRQISEISDKITPRLLERHLRPLRSGENDIVRVALHIAGKPVQATTHKTLSQEGTDVFVTIVRDTGQDASDPDDEWGAISELSHEMRTPLTSIKGAIRLLESPAIGDLPKNAKDILGIAARNSDRLLSMVDRILDFSRVSSRKIEKEATPVDLVNLVSSATSSIEGYGFQHGVSVQVGTVPQCAPVAGNTEQLTSVLTNLLSNAIKHSPKGTTVTASIAERDAFWRVSVFDKGDGIPEQARSKVFESYMRATPQPGVKFRGTGLGLAISKKIVLLHKGRIDFIYRDNDGTEFYFDIPKFTA